MNITVIREDGLVAIDGQGYTGIDLSQLDSSIHAIQWNGTEGELEIKDNKGKIIENKVITSFKTFDFIVDLWNQAKNKNDVIIQSENVPTQSIQ